MPPFEVLLPLGAMGLYLFDSVLLLYANELLFVRRAGGWGLVASSGLILFGRRLCLPNPLAPQVPQFRVRWSERDPRQEREGGEELAEFTAALRPLQYLVPILLLLLLALPLELFWLGTGLALLGLLAAFYLVILAALGYIYARRRELRLSGKAFVSLSFDSLACAPFALNLVRKLALRRSLAGNPLRFASATFAPAGFAKVVGAVCDRLREEQQREDGRTPRWNELETYRTELMEMSKCRSSK